MRNKHHFEPSCATVNQLLTRFYFTFNVNNVWSKIAQFKCLTTDFRPATQNVLVLTKFKKLLCQKNIIIGGHLLIFTFLVELQMQRLVSMDTSPPNI